MRKIGEGTTSLEGHPALVRVRQLREGWASVITMGQSLSAFPEH